jgi:hypothetical protein
MNLDFFTPTGFRENLLNAELDFGGGDTFYARLMRPEFSFSATNYQTFLNFTATTGSIQYHVVASTKTITRNGGNFISDGFVVGNHITLPSPNTGVYVIRSITDTVLRVDNVSAPALVDDGSPAIDVPPTGAGIEDIPLDWHTGTITCEDEYPSATDGYTRGGAQVYFTIVDNAPVLTPFNLGSFGTVALSKAPGIIIYVSNGSAHPIAAYGRLSPWEVNF